MFEFLQGLDNRQKVIVAVAVVAVSYMIYHCITSHKESFAPFIPEQTLTGSTVPVAVVNNEVVPAEDAFPEPYSDTNVGQDTFAEVQ